MKKFIALQMKEKRLRMNGKMMALTFFELYGVYVKIRTILFPYLLIDLAKEYYVYTHNPFNKFIKLQKKKNIAHYHTPNIYAAFCHMHVENLSKGPGRPHDFQQVVSHAQSTVFVFHNIGKFIIQKFNSHLCRGL